MLESDAIITYARENLHILLFGIFCSQIIHAKSVDRSKEITTAFRHTRILEMIVYVFMFLSRLFPRLCQNGVLK